MPDFRLCLLSEVPEGAGILVEPQGFPPLAIWRVQGDVVYVTEDTCTHGAASLTDSGFLDGYIIECGLHQGQFDVRDGSVITPPCALALKTYPAVVVDGAVHINSGP